VENRRETDVSWVVTDPGELRSRRRRHRLTSVDD
jgi:hypothetical protein